MKEIIGAILIAAALVAMFMYGFDRSFDNRCEYYKTLDMTPKMKEVCP